MTHYIMQWFRHDRFEDEGIREISKMFEDLAKDLDKALHESPEKEFMLRRLLESRDNALRAKFLDQDQERREHNLAEVRDKLYQKPSQAMQPVHRHSVSAADDSA